jgi:hypothetical protein
VPWALALLLLVLGLAAGATTQLPSVAICVCIRDQHVDVREWLAYHRALGVSKFYVWDTGSSPPLLVSVAAPSVRMGHFTLATATGCKSNICHANASNCHDMLP